MDSSKDDIFHRRFIAFLAVLLVAIGSAYIFMVTFNVVPKDNLRVVDTVLGFILGVLLASPIGFYFGASKAQSPAPTTNQEPKP